MTSSPQKPLHSDRGPNRSDLGLNEELFIMPFDHRGSFQEKLFGIQGRNPTPEETRQIAGYKKMIYEGFKKAVAAGVPKNKAGILVDEQFGSEILKEAHAAGFMTACPAEKSGQDEFDFEYGAEFGLHISQFSPTFVKVLIRYNPQGDDALNQRQAQKLKQLSHYCHTHQNNHAHQYKLMLELLVPATREQLQSVGGDTARYDHEIRPDLMIEAMQQLQESGVEPDLWKLEGIEKNHDCKSVAEQARQGGRNHVGIIILGRGENAEKVHQWLTTAAQTPGIIGFAVGRTIFWNPLKKYKEGQCSREEAVNQIAQNYKGFCDLWMQVREKRS